jgi:hypothetical protein
LNVEDVECDCVEQRACVGKLCVDVGRAVLYPAVLVDQVVVKCLGHQVVHVLSLDNLIIA